MLISIVYNFQTTLDFTVWHTVGSPIWKDLSILLYVYLHKPTWGECWILYLYCVLINIEAKNTFISPLPLIFFLIHCHFFLNSSLYFTLTHFFGKIGVTFFTFLANGHLTAWNCYTISSQGVFCHLKYNRSW